MGAIMPSYHCPWLPPLQMAAQFLAWKRIILNLAGFIEDPHWRCAGCIPTRCRRIARSERLSNGFSICCTGKSQLSRKPFLRTSVSPVSASRKSKVQKGSCIQRKMFLDSLKESIDFAAVSSSMGRQDLEVYQLLSSGIKERFEFLGGQGAFHIFLCHPTFMPPNWSRYLADLGERILLLWHLHKRQSVEEYTSHMMQPTDQGTQFFKNGTIGCPFKVNIHEWDSLLETQGWFPF